jgi:hypothetical protein
MANKQLRAGRPSLLLANRDPGDTDERAYEKALAKIESGPMLEFSGFRLHQRHPRIYAAAVKMIAEGLSTAMIARALGVSQNTVQAVRLREPVELEKTRFLDLVRNASRLCVERLCELIPTMSARDASIASGIMLEKSLLLAGEATSITLKKDEQSLAHQDFNAILNSLPQANARVVCDSPNEGEDKQQ